MALQAAEAGQVEFAIDTALGTSLGAVSCTFNPVEAGGQILKAARSLQEAAEAAAVSEQICKDIMQTAITRVPVVCELLCLGQLFSGDGDASHSRRAADLDAAMRQCCDFAFDALHEAVTAMYKYLQCSKLNRLRQAASIKELMGEKRMQLRHRFDDVNAYMLLANVLSDRQSAQQAQHTTSVVQELKQQVQALTDLQAADKARVKALAQAVLARQSPEGQKIRTSKYPVYNLAVSPSADRFATTTIGNNSAVWDAVTGSRMHELWVHSFGIQSVAWSPDGSSVATGSKDGTVAVWDVATGSCVHTMRGHSSVVWSVAWSQDGSRLATASWDRTAAVWDVATGSCVHVLRGHSREVDSVAWSPDGSSVATASWDRTAAVWDAVTGIRMHELHANARWVSSPTWSPDGSWLAVASKDECAAVWDAGTGSRVHMMRGHHYGVNSVAWSPDGSRLATASDDCTAAVWDVATGNRVHELRGHSSRINSVAWSPDGSKVATASDDCTAAVWDAATGSRLHELRGHSVQVRSVAWSPDSACVYTASLDTVHIYSIARRR